jgi:hypothetical protein
MTVPADSGPPGQVADTCRADPGQAFIGQRASAESGTAIMAATRSTRLRWVPPRTAVTMEYALGRVTVGYDDDYRITSVGCS